MNEIIIDLTDHPELAQHAGFDAEAFSAALKRELQAHLRSIAAQTPMNPDSPYFPDRELNPPWDSKTDGEDFSYDDEPEGSDDE